MKTSPKRTILNLITATLWSLLGSSCRSTVNGVGRDVERAGHNIHRSVN